MAEHTQCSKAYEDVARKLSRWCSLKRSWAADTVLCARWTSPPYADGWKRQVDCGQFGREHKPLQAATSFMLRPSGTAGPDKLRWAHFRLLDHFLYPRGAQLL
jgi:hypothetical protein